nr:MAG TPA: holin [Caudoviricetes sp.]
MCHLGTGDKPIDKQSIAMAVFTTLVQGILVAGLSTYVNQVIKQIKKMEE